MVYHTLSSISHLATLTTKNSQFIDCDDEIEVEEVWCCRYNISYTATNATATYGQTTIIIIIAIHNAMPSKPSTAPDHTRPTRPMNTWKEMLFFFVSQLWVFLPLCYKKLLSVGMLSHWHCLLTWIKKSLLIFLYNNNKKYTHIFFLENFKDAAEICSQRPKNVKMNWTHRHRKKSFPEFRVTIIRIKKSCRHILLPDDPRYESPTTVVCCTSKM